MPTPISIDDVMAWLQAGATQARNPANLLTQLADWLGRAGLPLEAMTLEVNTLHPLVAGAVFTWHRDHREALETPRFHDPFDPEPEQAPESEPES